MESEGKLYLNDSPSKKVRLFLEMKQHSNKNEKEQGPYTWKLHRESANVFLFTSMQPYSLPHNKMWYDYFTISAFLCLLNLVTLSLNLQWNPREFSEYSLELRKKKKELIKNAITQPPAQTLNPRQLGWGTIFCIFNCSPRWFWWTLSAEDQCSRTHRMSKSFQMRVC